MQSAVGSSRSNGSNATVSTLSQANTGFTEHDYIGLSEVSSSSHAASSSSSSEYVGSLGDTELNLGLSLSYKKDSNSNNASSSSFSLGMAEKAFVSQEERQNMNSTGCFRGGFKQWVQPPQERVWQGARILTAQDLQAAQEMGEAAGRSGFVFSNSNRPIMAPAGVITAGTKRGPNESVESDVLHNSSANPKDQAVGWPPIGSFRRRSKLPSHSKPSGDEQEECVQQPSKSVQNQGSSLYVKVNMDGVPIGRKVDLNAHDGYETLALTLEEMFQRPTNANNQNTGQIPMQKGRSVANEPKRSRLLDSSSDFVLTYEDKEGDWMLVGDVPWRMFVNTVKRLRIMKTSDANGLGPRCSEKLNRQKSKPI